MPWPCGQLGLGGEQHVVAGRERAVGADQRHRAAVDRARLVGLRVDENRGIVVTNGMLVTSGMLATPILAPAARHGVGDRAVVGLELGRAG